jgi:paraquat-inducible protein A
MALHRIHLEACPECDALLHPSLPEIGEKAHCPRCGFLLERPGKNSVERTLALSLAGLALIFPANLLPLVGIQVLGNTKDGVLFSGVVSLFAENMWAVALLVLLSSILFPVLNITLSLLISAHLFFNRPNRRLPLWMRTLQHLDEWAMLEVYMLGIIVAVVKLSSMAELRFGFGLYAFVGLLIITSLLTGSLDKVLFWRRIGQLLGGSSLSR